MSAHSSLWQELEARAEQWRRAGLWRERRSVEPLTQGRCRVAGREFWNFSTNDYLGLADHPRVIGAAREALSAAGAGARASAVVSGRTIWHEQLEAALARFEGAEQALLFPSGWACNYGVLTALVAEADTIFADRLNHASLIDGCRASRARLRVYRHTQLEVLERELTKAATLPGRRWIVTDGVFSMDGDVAPLTDLCRLAERYGADLIVDEAHGTGVLGVQGRGACEAAGVEERVAVRTGTLSKALGSLGGFVAGPRVLVDHLWQHARSQMFSTALPPASCAAATAALEVLTAEPARRSELEQKLCLLQQGLRDAGLMGQTVRLTTPIIPIVLGDEQRTLAVAAAMEQAGFLVGAIRPPTVPHGSCRLRLSLSVALPREALQDCVQALARAMAEVGPPREVVVEPSPSVAGGAVSTPTRIAGARLDE